MELGFQQRLVYIPLERRQWEMESVETAGRGTPVEVAGRSTVVEEDGCLSVVARSNNVTAEFYQLVGLLVLHNIGERHLHQ